MALPAQLLPAHLVLAPVFGDVFRLGVQRVVRRRVADVDEERLVVAAKRRIVATA